MTLRENRYSSIEPFRAPECAPCTLMIRSSRRRLARSAASGCIFSVGGNSVGYPFSGAHGCVTRLLLLRSLAPRKKTCERAVRCSKTAFSKRGISMQAVVFERAGDAEDVLEWREIPSPAAGPDKVLIDVRARSIQPADLLFIDGRYRVQPCFPQVAGFDGAGVIAEIGIGVHGLAVGQRVAFRSPGAWASFVAAPVGKVYGVPLDLDTKLPDEVVCQFALNPLTAWGLLDAAGVAHGARVLATAGRSSVAGLLGALAKQRGVDLLHLNRVEGGYALLRGDETVAAGHTINEALGTTPVFDAVLDAVGGPATLDIIAALLPGGRLVSYGVLDDRPFEMRAAHLVYRNLVWQGFGIDRWLDHLSPEALSRARRGCWELLAREPQLVPVAASFALNDINAAIQCMRTSRGAGKVLLI